MMYARLPDGGRLAYERQGEGPPLLLLRPLGGSLVCWGRFVEVLADTVHVISFDPRGVGRSSAAPPLWSTRQMANDALWLLDQLQLEAAHVYGISLGGMVATWLAIDAPARVRNLVLASTLPSGRKARAPHNAWSLLRCLAKRAADAEACLATRILSPQYRSMHPQEVRRVQELARRYPSSHAGLLNLGLAALRHDARAHLRAIASATLVLIGEYDPILTLASQRELLGALAQAQYAIIPGAGHDVSLEAPDLTAARVLSHIL